MASSDSEMAVGVVCCRVDGFRVIARTYRFPLIVEALAKLRARSCIIDGEAVACARDGVSSFDLIRHRQHDGSVFLWAFDLIELDGDDLRREPLEVRKATLASLLARAAAGARFNEHFEHDDDRLVFAHACKLGLEGIVSKVKALALSLGSLPGLTAGFRTVLRQRAGASLQTPVEA